MANKNNITPGNIPGPWYVDDSCIDCDLCRETAPQFFNRNPEIGLSVVIAQPCTPEEVALAQEALEGCPSESIGNDADGQSTLQATRS